MRLEKERSSGHAAFAAMLVAAFCGWTLVSCHHSATGTDPKVFWSGSQKSGKTAPCESDDHCKGDRVCEQGRCVSPGVSQDAQRRLAEGEVAPELLVALNDKERCVEAPGLAKALDTLRGPADSPEMTELVATVAKDDDADRGPNALFGDWLLMMQEYAKRCDKPLKDKRLAQVVDATAAVVSEAKLEKLVDGNDCRTLIAIDQAGMWPFEQRFSREVVDKQFTEAEITRKVWMKTLQTYASSCHKRLSERQKVAVETRVEKLEGIVGLTDALLIELRSKMLAVMGAGSAPEIASLAQAINERESALGSRRDALDAKKVAKEADLRRRVAEKRRERMAAELANAQAAAAAAAAAGAVAPGQVPGQPAGSPATTVSDVANTVSTVSDTVSTVRSIFGW